MVVGTNPTEEVAEEVAAASQEVKPAQETKSKNKKQCARGSVQAQKKKQCARDSVQETVCKGTMNPNQIDT